jgi:hypothetical protein
MSLRFEIGDGMTSEQIARSFDDPDRLRALARWYLAAPGDWARGWYFRNVMLARGNMDAPRWSDRICETQARGILSMRG